MATGRTVSRWVRFVCDDSSGTLREVPINSLSVVGLSYAEQDTSAFQDAVASALAGQPESPIEISGPFDNSVAAAAAGSGATPVLSGSHTVLAPIAGLGVPVSLGVYFGIRSYWATGDPVFGLSSSASVGFICTSYTVDTSSMTYTAKFVVYPGSAPAWGTSAIT